MAIGNLFLGAAKKTIGDIVLYRRNGVQQSRVRVRHIANPKTEAQALQRNYMAPVTKFYAPLADVLEKSWEGLNRSESLSAFLKANVTLARQRGWYVPKGSEFLALPYQVSKGILAPLSYTDSMLSLAETPNDIQVSTISAILVNMGYLYGDQITFVGCIKDDEKGDIRPVWSRFLLSESDTSNVFADIANVVEFISGADQLGILAVEGTMVGCALIVSRWDGSKWLRSTQFVKCNEAYLQTFTSPEARATAIASYRGGDSVVSSDIYLNGGTGAPSTQTQLLEIMNSADFSHYGYVIPVSVIQVAGQHILEVNVVDASSGAAMVVNVGRNRNSYLSGPLSNGHFRFQNRSASQEYTLKWVSRSESAALTNWLVKNGIIIQ